MLRNKRLLLSVVVLASLACSVADLTAFLATPTVPPPPTPVPATETEIPPPSNTPITHTPTFTLTPTMIGWFPTGTPTETLPATETLEPTPTVEENIILLPAASGFQSVLLSQETIYFGSECAFPSQADVRALVSDADRVGLVSFFMRLRNKETGNDTGWDIGTTMTAAGSGVYELLLDANDLHADDRYSYYSEAWIEFQLVAFDSRVREIGRTDKILERLTLSECP